MHLKLAPPLAEVVDAPPRQWFSFRRCAGKVDAYLNDSESHHGQHLQSYSGAPAFASRADARAWCREFAARKGIPYAEAPRSTSPPPTTTERNQREAQNIAAIMGRLDSEAVRVQSAGEFERAAELWIRGAAHCRELVKLWPGRAQEISAGGAARLTNARACLGRAHAAMVAIGSRRAFPVVRNSGGH